MLVFVLLSTVHNNTEIVQISDISTIGSDFVHRQYTTQPSFGAAIRDTEVRENCERYMMMSELRAGGRRGGGWIGR